MAGLKKKITWSFLWRYDHFYKCSGEKIHFCASIPKFSVDWSSDNSTSRIFSRLHPPCDTFRDHRAFTAPAVTTKLKSITKQMDTQPGRTREGLTSMCPYLTWVGLMLCVSFISESCVQFLLSLSILCLIWKLEYLSFVAKFASRRKVAGQETNTNASILKALSPGLSDLKKKPKQTWAILTHRDH